MKHQQAHKLDSDVEEETKLIHHVMVRCRPGYTIWVFCFQVCSFTMLPLKFFMSSKTRLYIPFLCNSLAIFHVTFLGDLGNSLKLEQIEIARKYTESTPCYYSLVLFFTVCFLKLSSLIFFYLLSLT